MKMKLASTWFGRCGGNWITEDVAIGFPVPEDTGQHDALQSV
jgi:hypothetical protein